MSLGAVVPLIQGDVPPPLIEVLSADEVKTALITLIVALIGTITALMLFLKAKLDRQQADLKAVKYQTENNHGPDGKDDNLRDQLDRMERVVTDGFRRMDHQFGEVHDRDVQTTHRIENLEERAEADHKQLRVEIARKRDK